MDVPTQQNTKWVKLAKQQFVELLKRIPHEDMEDFKISINTNEDYSYRMDVKITFTLNTLEE